MTVPQFFDTIINLVFPNICGICEKISKQSICNNCINQIQIYKNTKKVTKFNQLKSKLNSKIYIDEQIYFYQYYGIIREKLIQYKFKDKPYLYKMFTEIILNEELIEFIKGYNLIIPVPIDKNRKKQRGYNQTELIVKELAKKLQEKNIIKASSKPQGKNITKALLKPQEKNIIQTSSKTQETENLEIVTKVLYKVKSINSQTTMKSKQERIKNIESVFEIYNPEIIKGKNIIVFDDIFTTGSTANECAKVLKLAGAKKVGIITIAKD